MSGDLLLCIDSSRVYVFDLRTVGNPRRIGEFRLSSSSTGQVIDESEIPKFNALIAELFQSNKKISAILGLGSEQILSMPKFHIEGTSTFELEQSLPLDAENMSVKSSDQLVLVAIRNRIQPLVNQLVNDCQLDLVSIVPTDFLLKKSNVTLNDLDMGVTIQPQLSIRKNLIPGFVEDERFKSLHYVPAPSNKYINALIRKDGVVTAWLTGVASGKTDSKGEDVFLRCLSSSLDSEVRKRFWFEFVDEFSSRSRDREKASAAFTLFSALIFLGVMGGFMLLRSSQIRAQTLAIDNHTRMAFRESFPNERTRLYERMLKTAIVEQQELNAWTNENVATHEVLVALNELLTQLPEDVRFETTTLRFEKATILFEGKVKTTSDLDHLRRSLVQSNRLKVVDQTYGTSFSLTLELVEEEDNS